MSNLVVIGAVLIVGYGWEFSDEAAPFAAAILILGYLGVAIGAGLQRARRSAKRDAF